MKIIRQMLNRIGFAFSIDVDGDGKSDFAIAKTIPMSVGSSDPKATSPKQCCSTTKPESASRPALQDGATTGRKTGTPKSPVKAEKGSAIKAGKKSTGRKAPVKKAVIKVIKSSK